MKVLLISMLVSFFTTFFITPRLMKFLRSAGIVGLDLHKKNKPELPTSGGICVAFGVLAGLLTYVGIQTFVYGVESIYLLAAISTVLIITFVGLLDDLKAPLEKSKYEIKRIDSKFGKTSAGLSQLLKPLLTLPAAIPLMVISAGVSTMAIPFVGTINFGILYPLLFVPIGVVCCSNMVNLLGGFNGSETGMGIVYMLALGIFGLMNGIEEAIIFLISFSALAGFIKYNWYPAKILPGDSLTYLLGATVATGVILGNMEKAGIIVLFPFILETFLKLRSKFKATCLGKLRKDGKLDPPYGKKIFSLTHFLMNLKKLTERQVVWGLILIQIVFAIILFLGIF
jgi:UDP-N-acetylglucosamine--dolichyl-phosphate N-acetylglucosaminephosphotransferase